MWDGILVKSVKYNNVLPYFGFYTQRVKILKFTWDIKSNPNIDYPQELPTLLVVSSDQYYDLMWTSELINL